GPAEEREPARRRVVLSTGGGGSVPPGAARAAAGPGSGTGRRDLGWEFARQPVALLPHVLLGRGLQRLELGAPRLPRPRCPLPLAPGGLTWFPAHSRVATTSHPRLASDTTPISVRSPCCSSGVRVLASSLPAALRL